MRRCDSAAVLIATAMIALLSDAVQAAPPFVYVDDSAVAGGDGSESDPVPTIQEGIALLPRRGGVVVIQPGLYFGPILIDRDNVILWGDTEPIYDADGFLEGFTEEVLITLDGPLPAAGCVAPPEPVDAVELRGDNIQIHNVVVEAPINSFRHSPCGSSLSVKAENDDFYDNIVLSHILLPGVSPTGIWTRKANVTIEYVTSLDPGGIGINPTAGGHVDIRRAHIGRKDAQVDFLGFWERPREGEQPHFLSGSVRDCNLGGSTGQFGFAVDGVGILVNGRAGDGVNDDPTVPLQIALEITGNTIHSNIKGIHVQPLEFSGGLGIADTVFLLDVSGNTYVRNKRADVEIDFKTTPIFAGQSEYAANSSVFVLDGDGFFPDTQNVDLGPAENGNTYELIQP